MEEQNQVNYAALIKAVKDKRPTTTKLNLGTKIYSPQYGEGNVVGFVGESLIAKFNSNSQPLQFKNWQEVMAKGELTLSAQTIVKQQNYGEQIEAIASDTFRQIARELENKLAHIHIYTPSAGKKVPLPKDLPPILLQALKKVGCTNLYHHQWEALKQLRKGSDLALATPTASGKTLCYNLAILESCINNPETTALYIFPLKALALDQLQKLEKLTSHLGEGKIKVDFLTGDVPYQKRLNIFVPTLPNILAISPDLLHYQLEKLRHPQEWAPWLEFLKRLRWVVIDESHTYLGAFGAHFANLMRRLRCGVDRAGGNSNNIQYISASATIGNPAEIALRHSDRRDQPERLHLIDISTATQAQKTILSVSPEQSFNTNAARIIIALLEKNLTGIVFCNSRSGVKNLLALLQKEAQRQGNSSIAKQIAPFYGSLTGDHRRQLLGQLEIGKLKLIISTSALEAGIDLPELDFCIIRGYPGSIMSFRQRLGRVARKNPGLVIFLPLAKDPLDYYFGTQPQQLFSLQPEKVVFNADYPTILSKHIHCCCAESGLPLVKLESYFGAKGSFLAEELLNQSQIFLIESNLLWAGGKPHQQVNLRGNISRTIEIVDLKTGNAFEEMAEEIAYREVFPGAIYTGSNADYELVTYECKTLDLEEKKAYLEPLIKPPSRFTQATVNLQVQAYEILEAPKIIKTSFNEGRIRLRLHWGEITSTVDSYEIYVKNYELCCLNSQCSRFNQVVSSSNCPVCKNKSHFVEMIKLLEKKNLPAPYQTKYQAPVLKLEINDGVKEALTQEVNAQKKELQNKDHREISTHLMQLWTCAPEWLALHTLGHLLMEVLPMLVLSSVHDIDYVVVQEGQRTVAYFFDSCGGGNGACEAMFADFLRLRDLALELANNCDCVGGCPRCVIHSGCPQRNAGVLKELGVFLLRAIKSV